jgi:hypothetical protein
MEGGWRIHGSEVGMALGHGAKKHTPAYRQKGGLLVLCLPFHGSGVPQSFVLLSRGLMIGSMPSVYAECKENLGRMEIFFRVVEAASLLFTSSDSTLHKQLVFFLP